MIGTEFFYEDEGDGRRYRCWYTTDGNEITVRSAYGTEVASLGGFADTPEVLVRQILRGQIARSKRKKQ
jgi:hypothetical protein